MATYTVIFTGTATTSIDVEADNPEDARDTASQELKTTREELCIHCSYPEMSGLDDFGSVTREWPGEIQASAVEDATGTVVWEN